MASFTKLDSGWQYRVSYKDGDKYRKKSGNGYSTKREAQMAAAEVERLLNKGHVMDHQIVFMDYYKNWYQLFRKDKHSAKNNKDIEHAIKTADKFFKQTKMLDIDRNMYQEFLNEYGSGRASATVKKVHIYTRACLLDALEEGLIHRNPTYNVTVKGTNKKKADQLKFLNQLETKRLVNEVQKGMKPSYTSRYMILFALATGMRFSEVLAIEWDDIDFKNGYVTVNKSFDHVLTQEITETKTDSSRRVISIDNATLTMLKQYKLANGLDNSQYVFMGSNGSYVSNSGANKALKKACVRAGVQTITFHSLRHTHCSLLIYQGVNIKYISKRLGHSSITTTYQTYGHILDEMEQRESKEVHKMMESIYNA